MVKRFKHGYVIGFDTRSQFSLSTLNGVKMLYKYCSSLHANKRKKYILVFAEGPNEELDDTTLTAGTKYSSNITESKTKFVKVYITMEVTVSCMLMNYKDILI